MIEDQIVIGAKQKQQKVQEGLVIDKNFNADNFSNIIVNLKNVNVQEELMNLIQNCSLESKSIRWSVWRVLLGLVEKEDLDQQQDIALIIRQKLQNNREQYRQLDLQYNQKSEQAVKLNFIDPLSNKDKDNSNPWNNYFEDADLRKQIKIDVERTFQEKDFFRNLQIKKLLNNILFIWAKCNSHISYKQGMNELAGIIAFVCFTENMDCFEQVEKDFKDRKEDLELFKLMNDQCYAEADIFWALDRLLQTGHLEMFRTGQDKQPRSSLFNFYYKNQLDRNLSCAVMRSKRIFENYLHQVDPLLQKHLKNNGVEPQVFLLRWIRCIFQREFHLIDTLEIWDAILLEYYLDNNKQPLIFIDSICVSMIVFLKEQLLSRNDSTGVFQRLMKYPPVESVQPILNVAQKLKLIIRELEEREPSIFDKKYSQTKKDKLFLKKEEQKQSQKDEQQTDLKDTNSISTNNKVKNIFQMDEDHSNQKQKQKEKTDSVDSISKQNQKQKQKQKIIDDEELMASTKVEVDDSSKIPNQSKIEKGIAKVDEQSQSQSVKLSQQLESILVKIRKDEIDMTVVQQELQKCIEQAQLQEKNMEQIENGQSQKQKKKPILFI